MSMRVSKVLGAIFVLCCSLAQANEAVLARFFPPEKKPPRYVRRPITSLPRVDHGESPVDQYNAAVELNNRALDAMNRNDFETAVRLLASRYRQHIARENAELFPLSQRLLTPQDIRSLSQAMTARRTKNR